MMVTLYLAAVVAANVIIAVAGPWATVPVAAVMIGCTLTVRDHLHERWLGRGLRWRMAALIAGAGVLSWLASPDAGRIAVASGAAFAVSELVDSLVYHRLLRSPWAMRANWSNAAGALADSLVFPALAFGAWLPWIVLGQWVAKVAGGAAWVWVLRHRAVAAAAVLVLACALPSEAQQVTIGLAALKSGAGVEGVAEVRLGAPLVAGLAPAAIVSQPLGGGRPVVVTQAGRALLAGPRGLVGIEAGATWRPWAGYRPALSVGASAVYLLPARFNVYGIASALPAERWARTVVAGLAWRAL